ncbi:MAG: CAP domain-containing protein, partial [Clostridiales Family XIII bacterium]|nr:CAP domain-containing protein [Clostridiales Family XIII bacterium]
MNIGRKVFSLLFALAFAVGMISQAFAVTPASEAANELHALGLFKGVGNNADGTPNFDLNRAMTRAESITMLVRLLGKEEAAASVAWTPFTDVPTWAVPYVGYAYINGLTNGTSATTFGGNTYVTAAQYITFVLRALGYEDGKDFTWNKSWIKSDALGITDGRYGADSLFTRGDAASVSFDALIAVTTRDRTLMEELLDAGTIKEDPSKPVIKYSLAGLTLGDGKSTVEAGIGAAYRSVGDGSGSEWRFYGGYAKLIAAHYANDTLDCVYTNIDKYFAAGDGVMLYTDKNDGNVTYAAALRDPYAVSTSESAAASEQMIFELTNAFRARHGKVALTWNEALASAARRHSADMATRNFFDHNNPDGKSPGDRMEDAGYSWWTYAENISTGYGDGISTVNSWINSSAHRSNMLTGRCTELG